MNGRVISIIAGMIVVALIAALVFWQKNSSPAPYDSSEDLRDVADMSITEPVKAPAGPAVNSGITRQTIALHGSRQSCWTSINGAVYDLTSWVPQHPGGEEAILQLCGTDGSEKFNGQHGGAQKQAVILAGFKIGIAAQ